MINFKTFFDTRAPKKMKIETAGQNSEIAS